MTDIAGVCNISTVSGVVHRSGPRIERAAANHPAIEPEAINQKERNCLNSPAPRIPNRPEGQKEPTLSDNSLIEGVQGHLSWLIWILHFKCDDYAIRYFYPELRLFIESRIPENRQHHVHFKQRDESESKRSALKSMEATLDFMRKDVSELESKV